MTCATSIRFVVICRVDSAGICVSQASSDQSVRSLWSCSSRSPARRRAGLDVHHNRRRRRRSRPASPSTPCARSLLAVCGIVAIVSRTPTRGTPDPAELVAGLDRALAHLGDPAAVADAAAEVDTALRGLPGVLALADRHELVAAIGARLDQLDRYAEQVETGAAEELLDSDALEQASAASTRLRDVLWAIRRDRSADGARGRRSRRPRRIRVGASRLPGDSASVVGDRPDGGSRSRDSAGLHVFVWNHSLDVDDPAIATAITERSRDRLFQAGSVRLAAAGPDTRAVLRVQGGGGDRRARRQHGGDARADRRRRPPPAGDVGSAGRGVRARPHPLGQRGDHLRAQRPPGEQRRIGTVRGEAPGPYVVGVLNGDVDNHADLKAAHRLRIAGPVTTDAKVIPTLIARNCATADVDRADLVEAFRRAVASFEGSVAIGASSAGAAPISCCSPCAAAGRASTWASPTTGMSSPASRTGSSRRPTATSASTANRAASSSPSTGRRRGHSPGSPGTATTASELPVTADDVSVAEVTTRDIDRGDAAHFLLKEISESPESLAKTLRGRILDDGEHLRAAVGGRALPTAILDRLVDGRIKRIKVIGQGTAAVAGRSVATTLSELLDGHLAVEAVIATELSGFGLQLDMSDTLGDRRQPERNDHRHQPHCRPAQGPWRSGAGNRQPPLERSHRQGRRGDVHIRRP